jgi:hypothetical protein
MWVLQTKNVILQTFSFLGVSAALEFFQGSVGFLFTTKTRRNP